MSCVSTNYYQILETKMLTNETNINNLVFEDSTLRVTYNLWNENGHVSFSAYNKTSSNITIDLTKSFFILNGVANQYYQGRSYTYSSGINIANATSSGYYKGHTSLTNFTSKATTFDEQKELTIPTHSAVIISEFTILKERYADCNLNKTPTKSASLNFTYSNSPFVIRNRLEYYSESDTQTVEHVFFVNKISNYPERLLYKDVDTSVCGKKLDFPRKVFFAGNSNLFFIPYNIESE